MSDRKDMALTRSFSASWLRSKCSICSYQLNVWYEVHAASLILNSFLEGDWTRSLLRLCHESAQHCSAAGIRLTPHLTSSLKMKLELVSDNMTLLGIVKVSYKPIFSKRRQKLSLSSIYCNDSVADTNKKKKLPPTKKGSLHSFFLAIYPPPQFAAPFWKAASSS